MRYSLSGYVLESDVPLPLPQAKKGRHDIALMQQARPQAEPSVTWFHDYTTPDGRLWLRAGATDDGYLLRYPGIVDFYVRAREHVVLAHAFADVARTIGHLFLAQVWPMLLSQWGHLVLHAGAVDIEGYAVALVGRSGSGKSTLAGWFNRNGHGLLTDDLLVIDDDDQEPYALPSYSEQRLWSDSAEALFGPSDVHAQVAHYTDKLSVRVERAGRVFHADRLPLARIYVLDDPQAARGPTGITITPCGLREAYVHLLEQTFRLDITDSTRMRLEVEQLTALVDAVPVRRLSYPRRYDELDATREAVLNDVRA